MHQLQQMFAFASDSPGHPWHLANTAGGARVKSVCIKKREIRRCQQWNRGANPVNGTVMRKESRKPGSLISKLWRWHTKWCPGWKAYQEELAKRGGESGG